MALHILLLLRAEMEIESVSDLDCGLILQREDIFHFPHEQIGVKTGTAAVFIHRNRDKIEREKERLRLLPEDARRFEVERARSQIGRGMTSSIGNLVAAQHSAP
jgi:hypothetical protein